MSIPELILLSVVSLVIVWSVRASIASRSENSLVASIKVPWIWLHWNIVLWYWILHVLIEQTTVVSAEMG